MIFLQLRSGFHRIVNHDTGEATCFNCMHHQKEERNAKSTDWQMRTRRTPKVFGSRRPRYACGCCPMLLVYHPHEESRNKRFSIREAMVSWFRGFQVSWFLGFSTLGFLVSWFLVSQFIDFVFSEFLGFVISKFQSFKVSQMPFHAF